MQAALALSTQRKTIPTAIPLRAERSPSAQNACAECVLSKLCLPQLFATMPFDLMSAHLNTLVRHNKSVLHRKDNLFHQGADFEALYVVRTGAIKTCLTDSNGDTSVTGFYLPGDILGLDGINTGRHTNSAIALDTTSICALPFATLEKVASQVPDVQRHVFRIMAQEIQVEQRRMLMLSRKNAEQRTAAFLLQLSRHFKQRQLAADSFKLPMSRMDMGNYLGMAVETLCRIITKFERQGLLQTDGRSISDMDLVGLQAVVDLVEE